MIWCGEQHPLPPAANAFDDDKVDLGEPAGVLREHGHLWSNLRKEVALSERTSAEASRWMRVEEEGVSAPSVWQGCRGGVDVHRPTPPTFALDNSAVDCTGFDIRPSIHASRSPGV